MSKDKADTRIWIISVETDLAENKVKESAAAMGRVVSIHEWPTETKATA